MSDEKPEWLQAVYRLAKVKFPLRTVLSIDRYRDGSVTIYFIDGGDEGLRPSEVLDEVVKPTEEVTQTLTDDDHARLAAVLWSPQPEPSLIVVNPEQEYIKTIARLCGVGQPSQSQQPEPQKHDENCDVFDVDLAIGRATKPCNCKGRKYTEPPKMPRLEQALCEALEPLVLKAIYSNCSYNPREIAKICAKPIAKAALVILEAARAEDKARIEDLEEKVTLLARDNEAYCQADFLTQSALQDADQRAKRLEDERDEAKSKQAEDKARIAEMDGDLEREHECVEQLEKRRDEWVVEAERVKRERDAAREALRSESKELHEVSELLENEKDRANALERELASVKNELQLARESTTCHPLTDTDIDALVSSIKGPFCSVRDIVLKVVALRFTNRLPLIIPDLDQATVNKIVASWGRKNLHKLVAEGARAQRGLVVGAAKRGGE